MGAALEAPVLNLKMLEGTSSPVIEGANLGRWPGPHQAYGELPANSRKLAYC